MCEPQASVLTTPETANSRLYSSHSLFCTVRTPLDNRTMTAQRHSPWTDGAAKNTIVSIVEDGLKNGSQQSPERLSDVHLAFRKAEETATRRFQAASWLQKMVGPLDLSCEPSEEELRLCLRNGLVLCNLINKIHAGAVQKVVENATLSSPPEGPALSAYQYFENVRNFLVAIEEIKLPSFEASDLEKGSLPTGSSAKVVDCILALKSYWEWKKNGGHGLWKFGGALKSPCALKTRSTIGSSSSSGNGKSLDSVTASTTKGNSQPRKRWALLPTFDNPKNLCEEFASPCGFNGKVQVNDGQKLHGAKDEMEHSETAHPSLDHQISEFIFEIFHVFRKNTNETSETTNGVQNAPSQSLLSFVKTILCDKQPEEISLLVELLLKKMMEELEHNSLCQGEQTESIPREGDNDIKNWDCPNGSEGQQEQTKIEALQMELERVKCLDQEREFCLEVQKNEVEGLKNALQSTRQEVTKMKTEWGEEMKNLDLHIQGMAHAAAGYHRVVIENRELYNQVQDLKGNIRVYCRVRPFLSGKNGAQTTVDFIGDNSLMIINPTKQGRDLRRTFKFNRVFGPSASQEDVFLDTQPLIRSVLDGYNVCIFAYGQTGSGKTHTMIGPDNASPKDWGVNFRALHDLFKIGQSRKDITQYEVGVQMIEIYNEQVRDLLSTDGGNKRLEIRSSQQKGVNVPDANMVSVKSTMDVMELMNTGHKNRSVGATALNERSGRSHSVLTVHVQGTEQASGSVLRGCLHLVDLAGSERVDKSEAVGDRLKEAQHINRSLSALGDVIAALAQKSVHVPYRNSKLTQLLQDSLGGQAKTLMFVHISPDEDSYGETISTLKFAERVATVELGAAQANKETGEVRELKEQISSMRDLLAKKDAEIERLQKGDRSKGIESCLLRRMSVDVGNPRQPLEEMRNAEVRHSHILGSSAPRRMPHSEIFLDDPQNGSPLLSYSKHGASTVMQEDPNKRRVTKALRQAFSPDVSYNTLPAWGNISKNKIRHDSSREQEVVSADGEARILSCNSLSVQSNSHLNEIPKETSTEQVYSSEQSHSRDTGQLKPGEGNIELKYVDEVSLLCIQEQNSCSEGGVLKRKYDMKKGNLQTKRSVLESDISHEYSTEDSTGRRGDMDDEASELSEAEIHVPFVNQGLRNSKLPPYSGKLRHSIDRRSSNQMLQPGLPVKVASAAHTRSRRYSLIGSATFGVEGLSSGRSGGKPTLEAKLAISSEGAVECYAKTTLHRQLYGSTQVGGSSKSSKRWL